MRNLVNIPFDAVLTPKQMSMVRGGAALTISGATSILNDATSLAQAEANNVLSATEDDKRRERPGGGITTH